MPLPTSSLARICDTVREYVDTLGQETSPTDWEVTVTIGAPGANLAASNSSNTLNLFFYRFEPYGFDADALPGDVQWIKMFCVITAFGVDEDVDDNNEVDFSAGFNELRMLSQVMRLFQETPVMMIEGDNEGELWHTQFIPRPLADEQINQIWSTQGETIYRPSVVYEIALAPIEPLTPAPQSARVASVGAFADSSLSNRHAAYPSDRPFVFPAVPTTTVDTSNPQWAPVIAIVTGDPGDRQIGLSVHGEIPVVSEALADFSSFPVYDIWVAGDTSVTGDLRFVGQLLQQPHDEDTVAVWEEIDVVDAQSADVETIDIENLPAPGGTGFQLVNSHWGADASMRSWQLQLFAERFIRFDPVNGWVDAADDATDGIRIRSNPVLVTLNREES